MSLLSLSELKAVRIRDIERRTAEVLARGLTYNSVTVSLEPDALIRYAYLQLSLNALGQLPWVVTIDALDPTQAPLVLAQWSSPNAFTTAVATRLRDVYEADATLKANIRSAATVVDVERVYDTR